MNGKIPLFHNFITMPMAPTFSYKKVIKTNMYLALHKMLIKLIKKFKRGPKPGPKLNN